MPSSETQEQSVGSREKAVLENFRPARLTAPVSRGLLTTRIGQLQYIKFILGSEAWRNKTSERKYLEAQQRMIHFSFVLFPKPRSQA